MKDIFNKRQRFSIRKFSVGVASVLIGIALFTPSQGVLASTENSPSSVEKKQESQSSPENRASISSPAPKDTPIISTRTTELETSGEMGNNSLTTRASAAGEDRSSTPAVRAASNPSEVKKYELTDEYAKQIKAGVIGSEGNKLDSLLLNGPKLSPEAYTDDDYLKDKEELYIYEKGGKKYVGYNSHPLLEDTDGDGIIDSNEKPDEKLKWNVSERDMIMFMELSYRDDNYIDRVLDHKRSLTESELYKKNGDSRPRYEYMMMNKELGPYWERKKSYHTSSGLDAVLYETKSDFLYLPNGTAQVLAFRGTSDAKDIGADVTLGLGSNPQQGIDAENIMRELAKDKSITNLYLTGHSLGGYLVQRAMVEAYQLAYSDSRVMSPKEQLAYRNFYNNVLKKGTTFNAPKVVTSLVSGREFWQKGLDSKKIAKSGKMTHYIVDNDSTIRKGVSNDSDVVINVGTTRGGHSSRSYFEADMINRRPEFISGKRISLDGTGYQDKKIATVKSVEKVGETVVYSKRGDDIIKSITVSMRNSDTGQITNNTIDEVFKKDGAKSTVVDTQLEPSVRYEKDATKAKGEANVTIAGTPGTSAVTTTYSVNPNTGDLIAHIEQPVVKQPAIETVVKVAAKDEVEYIKKGDDVVKKTTSYTVNSKTGSLTSTEKEEVVNRGGARDIVEYNSVEPKPVYLKDVNSPKGTNTVQFPGKAGKTKVTTTYSVNPVNGTLTPSKGKPEVVTLPIARVVKVGAKDKVEVETIPSPVTYEKDISREKGQDNITVPGKAGSKTTTTTYTVNPDNGEVTPNEGNPVIVNPTETIVKVAAKDKVVETPIEPAVVYEKDGTRDFGTPDEPREGAKGKSVTTTRYDVNPNNGTVTEQVGNPVVTPAAKTIVKVGAKTKVERSKDDQGREVINTTTYEVNPKTGKVTPTTVTTYGTRKEATVEKRVVPSPVRYEKDDTKEKGAEAITVKGEDGEDTITTTYEVNPTTGEITPTVGKPVRTKEPTNTIVKIPAKDKVEVRGIPLSKRYVKDASREKGQDNITIPGKDGSKTTTTTYTVNPNNGEVTPNIGEPVIVNPTDTIIKVAAKDKVVYSKDGDNIVKEVTTYTVNSTNGNITEYTRKETFKENGLKDKVDVETISSPVKYEKDASREKGQDNITIPGKAGSKTTTTTYTVDPNSGEAIAHTGEPVIVNPTITIVKVAAKDRVVTSKDGNNIVKTATSYTVNPDNGNIIEHTTKETFKENGAKDKVEVETIPSPVKYEKDASREKGQDNITIAGKDGSKTTTTTYTVNPDNGEVTPNVGNPVIVNPTETIVKVAAKDKVVETPIEPAVVYEKDDTRDFGTPDERTEGEKGKTVTTSTYDVDSKDGHITEHLDTVVTPAGKTIVKVGAKTKVERNKDDQGREVINTTTYEVDSKTGKVTPTTVTTYGIRKEPTVEKRVVLSPVIYEKDDTKEKGTEATTVKGEDGEDIITTTYKVNPTTGEITPTVGQPVRTKEPTNTIVKIPAKDKVVYSKDGDHVVKTVTSYTVDSNTGNITEDISVLISNEHILESAKLDIAALLITKWVDEDGHDLKPAAVKEPATLGGANEALEAGEIEGYVFLKTEKDEENHIVKHIFKKVSSNRLIEMNNHESSNHESSNHESSNHESSNHESSNHESSNHESSNHESSNHESSNHETSNHESSNHETSNHESSNHESSNHETSNHESNNYESSNQESNSPQPVQSDNTERESEKVTPSGQVGETANNTTIKSNDSQNVLPNTGIESNATLASLGLLGMLSGLGLAFGKKRRLK
ncbi:G5 domain-containing protein [Streptococcus mitis]|uniref:Gram positive anchor n=1 Tax=Streptococcus mitis SK1080 TaxID=1008453 RepID=F9HQ33_STRMT|nr:G5 domain-containing protein [Streptococcus mitis]EGP65136.1 gram positive anchor [Streptococcus mitis SK1080]